METRKCKISAHKAGGNAGKDSKKYSLGLPSKWVHQMGMSAEHRDLIISFDGSVITVRKNDAPDGSDGTPAASAE